MNEEFFANRISNLRKEMGISAREMSLEIGQSHNYINKIETGKTYPSMNTFFTICEYFKISPSEFFDTENQNPEELNELIDNLKKLDSRAFKNISEIVGDLVNKH